MLIQAFTEWNVMEYEESAGLTQTHIAESLFVYHFNSSHSQEVWFDGMFFDCQKNISNEYSDILFYGSTKFANCQ